MRILSALAIAVSITALLTAPATAGESCCKKSAAKAEATSDCCKEEAPKVSENKGTDKSDKTADGDSKDADKTADGDSKDADKSDDASDSDK